MRVNSGSKSIYLALAGVLIVSTWPTIASSSKFEQSGSQKLGISESFGRWPDGVVPWVYNPTDKPDVFTSDVYFIGLLQDAMAEIEGVSGLSFVYHGIDTGVVLDDYDDEVVAVGWEFLGGAAGQAGPNSSCSGLDIIDIGYCQYVDGRVRFNTITAWDAGVTGFTEREFKQVAVHELLHLVGIGHSEKHVSIMFADPYTNLSHLRDDDIDALQSLYGEPDEYSQAPIYLPPGAADSSPLTDSFISTNLAIGTGISVIDGTELATFAGLAWKAAAPFTDDVTIVATDPDGYFYQGILDKRDCGGGICTLWKSFATMETLFTYPGTWTVYVIVDGELVETETVTVTTSPTYNQAPDSTFVADVVYGPAPLTVRMKLAVTGDDEGDAVNASWHIPGVGEIELDSGSFPGSAGTVSQTATFDTPGEYEVYTVVNDDWERYGTPESGSAAGAGFRTVYRTIVRVTEVSDDVTALPDVTSDATPDLATHVGLHSLKPQVNIISGADGSVSSNIKYLSDTWRGIAVSTVRDANQDGTANDPAVALLADHKVSGTIAVEVRRIDSGSQIRKINFKNENWRAIDVVVIDDMNGNSVTDDTAIGVLVQHKTNGKIGVEIRRLSDGSLVRSITFLTAQWHALAAAVVDRSAQAPGGTITPYIGVLAENRSNGKRIIESRLAGDGLLDRKINVLSSSWTVSDLTVIHDLDGNGAATDPAWQVLAIRHSDDLVRVLTLLVSNGAFQSNRTVLNSNWEGLRLASAYDMNGNDFQELLVAMRKRADGIRRIHVKDYDTSATILNISP